MQDLPGPYATGSDESYMYAALQVAQAGIGWTTPNPPVGCVIVLGDQIVGTGAHLKVGAAHAEVNALQQAGEAARGATAYVTLEPCTHYGRQPPCADALAAAGISRVVFGANDADPATALRAVSRLEALGIEVVAGVLKPACDAFLDAYLYAHRTGCAFLQLKLAVSLDAKLACSSGHSQWLSGPVSLGYAHYLRQRHDAVLVGKGTVLTDDPRLTTRAEAMQPYRTLPEGATLRHPVPVIIDPSFELADRLSELRLTSELVGFRPEFPRLVLVGREEHAPRSLPSLPGGGRIEVLIQSESAGPLSFVQLTKDLHQLGIASLLAEGGACVAQELIKQRAVNKLSLVYTPVILGADSLGFTPELGLQQINEGMSLKIIRNCPLGDDTLVEGYPRWPSQAQDQAHELPAIDSK